MSSYRGGEHSGHPSSGEEYRSRYTAQRLGAAIATLADEGFQHDEAVAFVAGIAFEIARERGETWHSLGNAKQTLNGLLVGRAAKHWSLDALDLALTAVADLTGEQPE